MRYLVISDIHANLAALDAVIASAGTFDRIWCLGDLTGYGPEPNECLDRLREYPLTTLAGNHDWAVLGRLDLDEFNREARAACLWTRQHLTAANRSFLESLPVTVEEEGYTLVHASPRENDPATSSLHVPPEVVGSPTRHPLQRYRAEGSSSVAGSVGP